MSAQDLINWGELSRILSGSRQTVRKNSIPKIHQQFVSELLESIEMQLFKLCDSKNAFRKRKRNRQPEQNVIKIMKQ